MEGRLRARVLGIPTLLCPVLPVTSPDAFPPLPSWVANQGAGRLRDQHAWPAQGMAACLALPSAAGERPTPVPAKQLLEAGGALASQPVRGLAQGHFQGLVLQAVRALVQCSGENLLPVQALPPGAWLALE